MSRRAERRRIAALERRLAAVEEREQAMRVEIFRILRMVKVDRAHLVFLRELLTDSDAAQSADREARGDVDRDVRRTLDEARERPRLRLVEGGGEEGQQIVPPAGRDRHGLHSVG
ncbi:hypothetical protein PV439_19655 [Streptomyces scabiei]|uniref:hypothetical protein n=1 Tax=Streptomyces scabiei TaxID=1930 RepID=UPI0029903DB5|nr:hypothetical protein [Streptomyces scabiei]MDW8804604.1 hypothetical protein [Streptomyces scabiei]MDX2652316.1 hypothetical protein [Streptomyces scabiei]MDX2869083.1 hypothetical protein [Streptomyces scabiei]MDX2889677.1 hypothetical protein [Streptomyces scabiei]MDX2893548.1 hypothetical protein [Streptomyces scabiei]